MNQNSAIRRRSGAASIIGKPLVQAGLASFLALCSAAMAGPARQVDAVSWEDVDRIVAVGDVHGDYDQYMKVLQAAGLVDRRGRWDGGDTHLVQTGDVPDRGPDTRKILDHLEQLQEQAVKDGGRVHTLIGNHDAMNVYGDLRYVSPGEYEAFVDRNSPRYREAQWQHHLATLEARDPEGFAQLDQAAFRAQWEQQHPMGWVEHRMAWQPDGDYGGEVLANPVVLKIDDTLFLHGGLSAKYCDLTLEAITERAHAELRAFDAADPGLIADPWGPLWYRGLATGNEAELGDMVDAILERYGAKRIVIGHTPTQGVVWPRFDGKVVLNDVGLADYYGANFGFLEIRGGEVTAHYAKGASLPLPADNTGRIAYLEQVVAINPANAHLRSRLERLRQAEGRDGAPDEAADPESLDAEAQAEALERAAAINPDNCRAVLP